MAPPSACPICSRHFRAENLALHVESCLQKSSADERRRQRAQELATPLFPLASPPSKSAGPVGDSQLQQARRHSFPSTTSAGKGNSSLLSNATGASPAIAAPLQSKKRRREAAAKTSAPLAERMRPTSLDDLVGQEELLGPGKLLVSLIQADRVPNMILWGPPGCGKTTLAHVISQRTGHKFLTLSGASSNMADLKDAIEKAKGEKKMFRRQTIVFVDEIHRFKKNVQDIFLPAVEDGTITLIGATTENPSFEINNALLSRCRVYVLKKHSTESIQQILQRAIQDPAASGLQPLAASASADATNEEEGDRPVRVRADEDALDYLAKQSGGDARVALNCLEMAVQTAPLDASTLPERSVRITEAHVRHCFAHRQTLFYDRNADFHYDLISAFHKAVRGSDDNAALYWLARMLEGGENPLFIARRMIRIASEDVGLAAPELLPQAVAAYHAAHFVGMPECDLALAQCATLLARAPKSVDVYRAYKRAKQSIREWSGGAQPDVPMHLRNAPTKLMANLGFNKGYLYNPDYSAEELKDQTYLPDELLGTSFFDAEHQQQQREDQ
ncbi:hypothetical protein PybrP1_010367 [[Pythium] brassicae (nom. inval.)]|nr:hypothetical protein PybrP1_010367 [[Pythium] brassicae (nom. inval.)]